MARLLYADPGSQLVYQPTVSSLRSAAGRVATVYADAAATTLADIAEFDPNNPGTPGPVIAGSTLTVDQHSLLPWFWGPVAGDDTLWVVVSGGPIAQINAYYDPRIDGMIPASLVDAKGDLLVATAADTVARLAVGATDGMFLRVRSGATAGIDWQLLPDPFRPVDHGFLTWLFDPAAAVGAAVLPSAGRLEFVRIRLPVAATVTNIVMHITIGGSGLTSGQNFAALYTSALALVGQTADQTTAWGSAGAKAMAIGGGPFALAAGDYLVGLWYNGSTAPTFVRRGNVASALMNTGLSSPNLRAGSADTGLTTAAPATMGAQTNSTSAWWAALS